MGNSLMALDPPLSRVTIMAIIIKIRWTLTSSSCPRMVYCILQQKFSIPEGSEAPRCKNIFNFLSLTFQVKVHVLQVGSRINNVDHRQHSKYTVLQEQWWPWSLQPCGQTIIRNSTVVHKRAEPVRWIVTITTWNINFGKNHMKDHTLGAGSIS